MNIIKDLWAQSSPFEHFLELIIVSLVVLIVFALIPALIVVSINRSKHVKAALAAMEHSKRYHELCKINREYHFNDIDAVTTYNTRVDSKQKYDRFNFASYFEDIIAHNLEASEMLLEDTYFNQHLFKQYTSEVRKIKVSDISEEANKANVKLQYYQKAEQELFSKSILTPVVRPIFRIYVRYNSPQGRNRYVNYYTFDFRDFEGIYYNVLDKEAKKATREYQRKLMTPSLRYEILQRDGFRCVLCGRSQLEDGVKLEVDHIVPISKGGKTERSNLRTLCQDCNRGKRDKYSPNGLN